jgi:hypothetical protein
MNFPIPCGSACVLHKSARHTPGWPYVLPLALEGFASDLPVPRCLVVNSYTVFFLVLPLLMLAVVADIFHTLCGAA